ncbi:MAG: hypothetical protein CMD43_02830 [Gammaproteobacteria bacterium]|nr:hypothetical protein [Gammaproteobacteria bacterium]|tara:strand:+ start:377 stop:1552 length:1176 start_codon:yes stop_codon:yes gene_type:complete
MYKDKESLNFLSKINVDEFYEKNKSYCAMPFKEIYGDNAGRYKLCCHAKKMNWKYTTDNTKPFDYFFSPEMEEIRNKMLTGKKIDACKVCYDLEKTGGESYRNGKYKKKYSVDIEPKNIGLKLRIHGSYCNLGCYMCHPYNSSTRRNELKKVFNNPYEGFVGAGGGDIYKPIKYQEWHDSVDDILKNIDLVSYMNITGGEPLQLPSHWKLIEKIPDEAAKHITLHYDTNLTELRYKGKSIFDYVDKFQDIRLGVSTDHYGEKEAWIRYPKDIKKFEENLIEARSIIKTINVTVSLLNVFDLHEIRDYYWKNFGIKTTFMNIVRGPIFLSIRNFDDKTKQELIKKYESLDDGSYIKNELLLPKVHDLDKLKNYCDSLSRSRNFNWRALWNEF